MPVPLGYIGELGDGGEGSLDDLIEIERPGLKLVSLRIPLARLPLKRSTRTFAESSAPVTLADKNALIRVDASAGPVVLNLQPIATLGDFRVQVAKIDASAHAVTINRGAGDTINGTQTYVLAARYHGVELAAQAGTSAWLATSLAPSALSLDSPAFTGTPTAPTAQAGNDTTQLATTAFVAAAIAHLVAAAPAGLDTLNELATAVGNDPAFAATITAALAGKAPLVSPDLSGTPTAPTAAAGTNTAQIATTAFVVAAIASLVGSAPGALDTLNELAAALGNDANFAATVTNALAGKAPLASPVLTGMPTAPTAPPATNTDQIATTKFVRTEIGMGGSGGGNFLPLSSGAGAPLTGPLYAQGTPSIVTTGAVSIGAGASPGHLLHVKGAGGTQIAVQDGGNAVARLLMKNGARTFTWGCVDGASFGLADETAGAFRLLVDYATGNVNVAQKLQVTGQIRSAGDVRAFNDDHFGLVADANNKYFEYRPGCFTYVPNSAGDFVIFIGSEVFRIQGGNGKVSTSGQFIWDTSGHLILRAYTTATRPSAAANPGRLIWVTDDAYAPVQISNGGVWLKVASSSSGGGNELPPGP